MHWGRLQAPLWYSSFKLHINMLICSLYLPFFASDNEHISIWSSLISFFISRSLLVKYHFGTRVGLIFWIRFCLVCVLTVSSPVLVFLFEASWYFLWAGCLFTTSRLLTSPVNIPALSRLKTQAVNELVNLLINWPVEVQFRHK